MRMRCVGGVDVGGYEWTWCECGVVWLIGVVCILLYAFVCAYVGGGGCKWVWRV